MVEIAQVVLSMVILLIFIITMGQVWVRRMQRRRQHVLKFTGRFKILCDEINGKTAEQCPDIGNVLVYRHLALAAKYEQDSQQYYILGYALVLPILLIDFFIPALAITEQTIDAVLNSTQVIHLTAVLSGIAALLTAVSTLFSPFARAIIAGKASTRLETELWKYSASVTPYCDADNVTHASVTAVAACERLLSTVPFVEPVVPVSLNGDDDDDSPQQTRLNITRTK